MCVCVCLYVCEYHKREDMTHLRLIQGGFIYNVTVMDHLFIYSLICSQIGCLFNIYYLPEIVLDAGNTAVNKNKVKFLPSGVSQTTNKYVSKGVHLG